MFGLKIWTRKKLTREEEIAEIVEIFFKNLNKSKNSSLLDEIINFTSSAKCPSPIESSLKMCDSNSKCVLQNLLLSTEIVALNAKVKELESELQNREILRITREIETQSEFEEFKKSQELLTSELIENIYTNYQKAIEEWKCEFFSEYLKEIEEKPSGSTNYECQNVVNNPGTNYLSQVSSMFHCLKNDKIQAVVAIGVVIISVLCPLGFSWRFIKWAWPKLVRFAEKLNSMDIPGYLEILSKFINSDAFKEFTKILQSDEPLSSKFLQIVGSDVVSYSMKNLAPLLFAKNQQQSLM